MRTRTIWMAVLVVAGSAACRSGEDDDSGVASLDDTATESAAEDGSPPPGTPEPGEVDDAFVDFAQCLRDQGIDAPALVDDETFTSPGPEIEAEHPGYEAAYDACIPIVEEVTGPFDVEMSPEEIAEMQDGLLAIARCMRGRGYDYPDPLFGDDGMVIPDESEVIGGPTDRYVEDWEDCADEVSGSEDG
jgi:hypothetical protein